MKDRARLAISVIFVSPLLAWSVLAVQQTTYAQESDTTTATTESQTEDKTKQERKKRVEAYKKAATKRFTEFQKTRYRGRCKAAQVRVGNVEKQLVNHKKSRQTRYDNLVSRLEKLAERVKAKNEDGAVTLTTQIGALKQKIAAQQAALDTHILAIQDLAGVECVDDTDAFLSALELARTQRQSLRQHSVEIKTYLKDEIKPTLVAIRTALATDEDHTEGME